MSKISIQSNLKWLRWSIMIFAALLALSSIIKLYLNQYQLFDAMVNTISALIFVLISELIEETNYAAFYFGVILSVFILVLYFYMYGEDLDLLTFETLMFVLIDISLKLGDKEYKKLQRINNFTEQAND